MKRRFNITGLCTSQRHYMVRLDGRLKKIKEDLVDYGSYFVINRGRQYGKTTMLRALRDYLKEDYIVASLDFQELGTEEFADAPTFSRAFAKVLMRAFKVSGRSELGELLDPLAVFAGKRDSSLP